MTSPGEAFDEHEVLHALKHHLPAQAPLKDFIHHNTLHSFQHLSFHKAIREASAIFGYRVSLSLAEYRTLYAQKRISHDILRRVIIERKGERSLSEWEEKVLSSTQTKPSPRIGTLRSTWKRKYAIDMDSIVHPILFRILCSYLDQGIAIWNFPVQGKSFIDSIRELERKSMTSFFRKRRAKELLLNTNCEIKDLLDILIGDESLFKQYIYDQQFAHQGWSGMFSAIEDQPQTLLERKQSSIHDLIVFETLLEIDALDYTFGDNWKPMSRVLKQRPQPLFAALEETELDAITAIWQEAFEWTYYDQILAGLGSQIPKQITTPRSFQAMFCIDDRECSLRRYLEEGDPLCETFGTPGFFSVEFFFQPEDGKFYTKLCPAPVTPKYLIKETGVTTKREKELHFTKHSHSWYGGWLISQTLGFWSALKLFLNIFRPSMTPASASSFRHMDRFSKLTIENKSPEDRENGLQIGFNIEEMAQRVEGLLKGIGLVKNFAPVVYVIGHGSSSVNNPHYAAYDCGACSGRAGSVNARTICFMANHPRVREMLRSRGLDIPDATQFIGGLHDTTRDEIQFFDEDSLSPDNRERHNQNGLTFGKALDKNAKERSRRFVSVDTRQTPEKIHAQIIRRSVSLFEPRPELNHATNTLCVVGRRSMTRELFLDRRAFLNSYDYTIDREGKLLFNIMKPLGPVCGGINLEYFFSRVDNQKLGAGTKLPHNVMGLFGVANGIDGDLRPGLPSQMIEVHDPIRLLIIVEHFPEVVLETIQKASDVYEWFINDWVRLVAVDPETRTLYLFDGGKFTPYHPLAAGVQSIADVTSLIESTQDNLPVYSLSNQKV
jgi:uncharacterized protein YbcC (UPF0753/DUF2309 family)